MAELGNRAYAAIAPRSGQEAAVARALHAHFGLAAPDMGAFVQAGGTILARVAPHQFLAMRDGDGLFAALEPALRGVAGVFDLSDARTGFVIAGPEAPARLRLLLPIDLRSLAPGRCAQTIMAQLTVLVCQMDAAPTYELHCARSYRSSFLHALG